MIPAKIFLNTNAPIHIHNRTYNLATAGLAAFTMSFKISYQWSRVNSWNNVMNAFFNVLQRIGLESECNSWKYYTLDAFFLFPSYRWICGSYVTSLRRKRTSVVFSSDWVDCYFSPRAFFLGFIRVSNLLEVLQSVLYFTLIQLRMMIFYRWPTLDYHWLTEIKTSRRGVGCSKACFNHGLTKTWKPMLISRSVG